MKKNSIFLLAICLITVACSKNENNDPNIDPVPDPVDTIVKENPGLMHIQPSHYTAENSSLMLQDDEPDSVFFSYKRSFVTNKPLVAEVTSGQKLWVRFFSARPVKNVKIYASLPGGGQFKLATYDSISAFGESWFSLPKIKQGDKLILASGDSMLVKTPFTISENDTLTIRCNDSYYQKVATLNKCPWYISYYSYQGPGYYSKRILPVHARESVAFLANMTYLFSSEEFVAGHLRLQGKIYGNMGPGNPDRLDMQSILEKLYVFRMLKIAHVTQLLGLAAVGGSLYGLSEYCWFGHYHDTTDGDASLTAFHEFGHVLGYLHESNMTEGTMDSALWPVMCQKLYSQMCIREELPVWSSTFLKSKYCKNSYYYDEHQRP